ncbi:MAG: Eco57I restriction-modification methylase domain-containing protein [Bacteroidota bacterium]
MKELVENLIANFNHNNLVTLFRNKSRSFKYEQEELSHFNDDLFSDCTLLGSFKTTDDELEILVFTAKTNNDLTERSGKKRQYELGKRLLKEQLRYSGGFFVFYDSNGAFRFSFIYDIPLPNGKVRFSNFKRYTYFVSPEQTNKTFIRQVSEAEFTSLPSIVEAFSVDKVRAEFYREIACWFFWAMDKVRFPNDYKYSTDPTKDTEIRNSTNLIRLLTRIIFIWFLKEKKLIPHSLFDAAYLKGIVKDLYKGKDSSNYYNAILQNLFFGTLNQKMSERTFAREADLLENRKEYGVKNLYRYADMFSIPSQEAIALFKDIPFLNGGLFDCLDKEDETGKVIYIDGFSRNPAKQAIINDYLFFQADEERVNLSAYEMGKDKTVRGLFEILKSYSFTIDESTPVDQEVALDPEMLGKVFEELLASYNPETSTTARKATGSFYTPREIVDYMVQQSVKHYLLSKTQLDEATIEKLIAFTDDTPELSDEQKEQVIGLLDKIKILDPACGSGAFPMGILHQLVYMLQKLDPDNKIWYDLQYSKALEETQEAFKHSDKNEREELLKEINESFDEHINYPDYARKLYLIENCIYGVDIQPIAIQISKLRFFISLVLDQKIDSKKENYGIRPLPNLETKFVAANTLIGINVSKNHTYYTDKIRQIEKEIAVLRHKYFLAKTRSEKRRYQEQDKMLRNELKDELLKLGYTLDWSQKIIAFDIFDTNAAAHWFDPEWMFGVTDGFDIVIGNPPYVSTKGVSEKDKKVLQQQFGFADDLYNHFYFKGIQLLKEKGILAYISSKTFWTIQTKKNLRELILKNKLLQLVDTANPFESAMVDTCITIVQKENASDYDIKFIDLRNGWDNKKEYSVKDSVYKNVVNNVFFEPNEINMKIYEKIAKKLNPLIKNWWSLISTSKNIEKYKTELENYRQSLKPGDITLLGLITEGGQGLATANNGKYIGVLEGTKWADKVRQDRVQKLWEFIQNQKPKELIHLKSKTDVQLYLNQLSEKEIRNLFDDLKENYGRDIFGQGSLYRIVNANEIADVEKLTQDEKLNGISGTKTFVPYDKGDKDGNRWWAPTPYYIDWSRENVKFLKENSGKKGEGMPVVRNPQFYFREGFCWSDIHTKFIKCRIKESGIHDVKSMSLFSLNVSNFPDFYFVTILNSTFISEYVEAFIKNTQTFQINDARQLPIIIPTQEQLKEFEAIFDRAMAIQKQKFLGTISENKAQALLDEIQRELDEKVMELYGVKE